jgi:hypothetical protein
MIQNGYIRIIRNSTKNNQQGDQSMKYYKVSNSGFDSKVIVAHSGYEARGFYLMEINDQLGFVDDIIWKKWMLMNKSRFPIPFIIHLRSCIKRNIFGKFQMLSWKLNKESTLPIFRRNRIKPLDITPINSVK